MIMMQVSATFQMGAFVILQRFMQKESFVPLSIDYVQHMFCMSPHLIDQNVINVTKANLLAFELAKCRSVVYNFHNPLTVVSIHLINTYLATQILN